MNKRSFHDVAGAGWGRKIRSTLVKVFKSFFIRIALVNEQRNVCQLLCNRITHGIYGTGGRRVQFYG